MRSAALTLRDDEEAYCARHIRKWRRQEYYDKMSGRISGTT